MASGIATIATADLVVARLPTPVLRTLAKLFAQSGTTGEAVAPLLPLTPAVDPELFRRVDNGRQPLPMDVAQAVAAQLGVALGTVLGAAGLVTLATGPAPRVPVPPDPLLGDDFLLVPLSPLVT
jgi:hypothetical protein